MYCLLDERESGNERLFTDTMLAIFYQFDRIWKAVQAERWNHNGRQTLWSSLLDARTSNNCVPPNL